VIINKEDITDFKMEDWHSNIISSTNMKTFHDNAIEDKDNCYLSSGGNVIWYLAIPYQHADRSKMIYFTKYREANK
jgi:hypothetical protein